MRKTVLEEIFGIKIPVIGVVHLLPLPGSPRYDGTSVKKIAEQAIKEAGIMAEEGINGIIIENFRDNPFFKKVGPETVAAMTYIASRVKENVDVPIGLCVLQSDGIAAVAISKSVEASFIRIPYYTETYVVDTGLMDSIAAELQRYKKNLGCDVKVLADVHIKHGYPLAQRNIEYSAEDAYYRGLADAIIITGRKTGGETRVEDVKVVREALPEIPIIVGSGVSTENVEKYLPFVDGIIVGTSLKKGGITEEEVDPKRVRELMNKVEDYRSRM